MFQSSLQCSYLLVRNIQTFEPGLLHVQTVFSRLFCVALSCDLVGHKPTVYFVMIYESRLILSLYETQVFGELHGGRPGWSDAWVSPLRGPRHHPTQESTHAHEDHMPVLEKGQANPPPTPHGGWGYRIKNPRARTHWRQVPGVRTWYKISNIDVALHSSVKIDKWNLLSTVWSPMMKWSWLNLQACDYWGPSLCVATW